LLREHGRDIDQSHEVAMMQMLRGADWQQLIGKSAGA
jgi:hypothetical protein